MIFFLTYRNNFHSLHLMLHTFLLIGKTTRKPTRTFEQNKHQWKLKRSTTCHISTNSSEMTCSVSVISSESTLFNNYILPVIIRTITKTLSALKSKWCKLEFDWVNNGFAHWFVAIGRTIAQWMHWNSSQPKLCVRYVCHLLDFPYR